MRERLSRNGERENEPNRDACGNHEKPGKDNDS